MMESKQGGFHVILFTFEKSHRPTKNDVKIVTDIRKMFPNALANNFAFLWTKSDVVEGGKGMKDWCNTLIKRANEKLGDN